MEIQRLILIDFTGLNGGIKKGSIDAILLSIEMIEKGFCTGTGFPAENSHNKAFASEASWCCWFSKLHSDIYVVTSVEN